MNIVFLFMTLQAAGRRDYSWNYRNTRRPSVLPETSRTWAAAITRQLARRGHHSNLIVIEKDDFIRSYFLEPSWVEWQMEPRFSIIYASDYAMIRAAMDQADAIAIRDHFDAYHGLFAGFDFGERKVVQIMASTIIDRELRFMPKSKNYKLFVNSEEEQQLYARREFDAEIFLKPAADVFYENPDQPVEKLYDVAFVCWNTKTKRKRFAMLLDALRVIQLDFSRSTAVAVIGRIALHENRIKAINDQGAGIAISTFGQCPQEDVRKRLHESRVLVVASSRDANPQVISEGLACNVPVACARDLSGGRFQINSRNGELFDPTPSALARTIVRMLDGLDRYRPRAHSISLADATDQIEAAVGAKETVSSDLRL